jgi:hypothetical protein
MGNGNITAVNQSLDQLHGYLIALNAQLNGRLDTTTDPQLAQRIITEMREVVHRIDLVQSVLFTRASDEVSAAVAKVAVADNSLVGSLKTISDVTNMVKTVSSFLTLVDDAIDLAKTI